MKGGGVVMEEMRNNAGRGVVEGSAVSRSLSGAPRYYIKSALAVLLIHAL